MARTRASKGNDAATKADSTTTTTKASRYALSPPSNNPPKIFILPTKASGDARIVSLLHPRYAKPTRYLVCPETGFYEFTRIAAPKNTPRSWLIQADGHSHKHEGASTNTEQADNKQDASFGAYVTNGAELFLATPIDPLFLVLPTLTDPSSKAEKRRYISSDDYFDRIQAESPHLWEVMRWGEGRIRSLLEARLAAVCDTVEPGDDRMYRFNENALAAEVLSKARRMSARPLPRSMEEKFVVKPLEAPVLGVKRQFPSTAAAVTTTKESVEATKDDSSAPEVKDDETSTLKTDSSESQSSGPSTEGSTDSTSEAPTPTAAASFTTPSTEDSEAMTELLRPAITASPEVIALQRLRTAINFLCASYIPPSLATMLQDKLCSSSSPNLGFTTINSSATTVTATTQSLTDFSALDTYLAEVARLKQEAMASRSAGDYSRKHAFEDDDEAAERAEKKRKKEEEEKRKKANESRGVRELKKVNTAGMKKMSDFFKKKT